MLVKEGSAVVDMRNALGKGVKAKYTLDVRLLCL